MTWDELIRTAPLISACTFLFSVIVAFFTFIYTRRVNRRRATLDMVMRTFLDEEARSRYEDFKALVAQDQDPADAFSLATLVETTADNRENRYLVIQQLNVYELVSLGIRRKLFDEHFYKLWFHRQFTKDFESLSSLVEAIQVQWPTNYCEYRALYERWMKKRHPVAQPNRFVVAWWAFTKNYKRLDEARTAMKC